MSERKPTTTARTKKARRSPTRPMARLLKALNTSPKSTIDRRPKRSVSAPPARLPRKPEMENRASRIPACVIPTLKRWVT